MVRIHVDDDLCKGCGICIEFCPQKVYEFSKQYSKRGVKVPVPARESKCTVCRICELMCPDMALDVEDEGK